MACSSSHSKTGENPPLLRCDRSIVPDPDLSTVFDYSRFTLYLKRINDLERFDRILKIRHGKKVAQLEDFTDEVLALEFTRTYGEMDTKTAKYNKLFANYKTDRLAEVSEWVEEEDDMINELLHHEIKIINLNFQLGEEFQVDLQAEFSPEEYTAFSNVGLGAQSGVERFILPRKQLETVQEARNLDLTSLNLGVFDPQINLPPAALPFTPSNCNVSPKLASTLQQMMYQHNAGINLSAFLTIFNQKNRYDIDYKNLGYDDFGSLIHETAHVIWQQEIEGHHHYLLYPTYLQGLICPPKEFFWKILHRIYSILPVFDGIVSVNAAFDHCEKIFGFKIDATRLRAWGFSSLEDFTYFLFGIWPRANVVLRRGHELSLTINFATSNTLFIVVETSKVLEELERIKMASAAAQIPKKTVKTPKPSTQIPSTCLQIGESLDSESEFVPLNQDVRCELTYSTSPTDFYVAPVSQLEKFQQLVHNMRSVYSYPEAKALKVNPINLSKGSLYVALISDDGSNYDPEYCRVQYVEKKDEPSPIPKHKVMCIDYGFESYVKEDSISYFLKSFAELPSQAIPCCLINVEVPLGDPHWFDKPVNDHCHKLLASPQDSKGNPSPILVSFRSETEAVEGKRQWLVRACGANRAEVPDVARAVMEYVRKHYPNLSTKPIERIPLVKKPMEKSLPESMKLVTLNSFPKPMNTHSNLTNPQKEPVQIQTMTNSTANKPRAWNLNPAVPTAPPPRNPSASISSIPPLKKPSFCIDQEIRETARAKEKQSSFGVSSLGNVRGPGTSASKTSWANIASTKTQPTNPSRNSSVPTDGEDFPSLLSTVTPRRRK